MAAPRHLTRRGTTFWFRRRLPKGFPGTAKNGRGSPQPVFAASLGTACSRQARHLGARINGMFEYALALCPPETGPAPQDGRTDRMDPDALIDMQKAFLGVLRDAVRASSETVTRVPVPEQQARLNAIEDEQRQRLRDIAEPVAQDRAKVPTLSPQTPARTQFGDDFVEIAFAACEGLEEPTVEEFLQQLDHHLVFLMDLLRVYVDYCARKGQDPANALPVFRRISDTIAEASALATGTLQPLTEPIPPVLPVGTMPAATAKSANQMDGKSRPNMPAASRGARECAPSFSEVAARYVRLRGEGYELKRRNEVPETADGAAFERNMRRNVEASIALFLGLCGDIPIDTMTGDIAAQFIKGVERIPPNHGKSAKDTRSIAQVIADADAEEQSRAAETESRLRREGRTTAEIEDAVAAVRIPRLRTNTVLRHTNAIDQIFGFAVFDGLIERNVFKDYRPSAKQVKRRLEREPNRKRLGWGKNLAVLLKTPIFSAPLEDVGEPLFWAPLIAAHTGMRMEEILQLRTTNFEERDGIPFLRCEIVIEGQTIKSGAGHRWVPIHSNLLEIGLVDLVEHRKRHGLSRLFPQIERGASKGTFSERFSKSFARYIERQGVKTGRGLDFHSFRTEVVNGLLNGGVSMVAVKLLVGHSSAGDTTVEHYFEAGFTSRNMLDFISRLNIDTSHIRNPLFPEGRRNAPPSLRVIG